MASRSEILGTIAFWTALLGCSGGAFYAGFYYTHKATENVPVREPLETVTRPTPKATPAPTPTPTLAPGPILTSVPPATPSPTSTPVPLAVKSETPTAPPATPTPDSPPIYRVQVGAFDSRESAQKQVDDLQTQGINAVVVWDSGSYRAQLGAFSDRARALSVADEVNVRGFGVTIRH